MATSEITLLDTSFRTRSSTILAVLGLLSLLALPTIGSQLYFRHDDASFILLSARFHGHWLSLFSTDSSTNTWGTLSGMSGYYRPTEYLLALALVRTIGVDAPVLMALAGAAMAVALALHYVTARIIAGPSRAVIALYLALIFGSTLLYQSFRLMVPWGYLLIMVTLVCLLLGAKRRSTMLVLLGGVFWFLSSSRQSALLLVPAVILSALIAVPSLTATWPSRTAAVKRFTLLLSPFIVLVAATVIVNSVVYGSSAISLNLSYFAQRYRFYAATLFAGPRSLLLIPPLYCLASTPRWKRGDSEHTSAGLGLLPLAASAAGALAVAFVPELGPVVLAATGVLVARRMRVLWVGTTWFVVGFAVYLVPDYYHQAYIVEAFLGLTLVVACCTPTLARAAYATSRTLLTGGKLGRRLTFVAAAIILAGCVIAGALMAPGRISSARAALTGLVSTNRTFSDCVTYFTSLPESHATILAFSDEQLGLYQEDWRNRGLAYRATAVPVMDEPQLHDLLEALRGPGMVVEQFADPRDAPAPHGGPLYGIAFSEVESKTMAGSWIATPVARIVHGDSTCTVFRLRAPPR